MNPSERRAQALKPQLERDRKRFLGKKGWQFVSPERMDELCQAHHRRTRRIMFFGRRTTIVQDSVCRLRAVIKRSRRLPAEATQP